MTNGRPSDISVKNGWFSAAAGAAHSPDFDGDASGAKKREAAPADQRIRILDRRHHATNAGIDDALDARAGAAKMAARLERAVQRGAAGARSRLRQRPHFGVRLARALVVALPDHDAVRRHQHRANQRIRTGPAAAAGRVKQRALHVVAIYHFSSNRPSTYSSAENGTRSSIPSPTPT